MVYLDQSVGSSYSPKLLGSYECELGPIIETLPEHSFRRCVDIGAAEGYYAIGLARRLGCDVTSFETDPQGQKLVRSLARVNGVADRMNVLGICTPESLRNLLSNAALVSTFLLCDVEGFEDVLLNPVLIPQLLQCWILVEIHEFAARGVGARLRRRFEDSHRIECIRQRARVAQDFPSSPGWTRLLPKAFKVRLMQEGRPEAMSWLWMTPKVQVGRSRVEG